MKPWIVFHLALLLVASSFAHAVSDRDLAAIADESTVELTTTGRKSGRPRAVTIWFVYEEGKIYVQSGRGGETEWYRNLRKRPEVRLRFEDLVVEGRAAPVNEEKETERIHSLFLTKYWTARISSWFGGGFGTGRIVKIEPLTSARGGAPAPSSDGAASAATPPARPPE